MSDTQERFWSKVQEAPAMECWLWRASLMGGGYGGVRWEGRSQAAHRVAYKILRGDIPAGLVLDHLCRNRGCVNPWHLEPVTHAENIRRGTGASSLRNGDMCRNGLHPWPESSGPVGVRQRPECIPCRRAAYREWKAKNGKARVVCPCGASVRRDHISHHQRSSACELRAALEATP